MINVTRLNGTKFVINADLIETLEETPDTVIALLNGNKYVVTEAVNELVERVIKYRQQCSIPGRGQEEGKEL